MDPAEERSRQHYERRARAYDMANQVAAFIRGVDPTKERRRVIRRLRMLPGQRLLEVASGTGTNFPLIAERHGATVRITGLDITRQMLTVCQEKIARKGVSADLVEGSATTLPFADGAFDAVLQHGGLAEFPDRRAAIAEMFRVVRPNGRVVICDVDVPEDGRMSLANRLLMLFQPEYRKPPPMNDLPPAAAGPSLKWISKGGWYLVEFTKPSPVV